MCLTLSCRHALISKTNAVPYTHGPMTPRFTQDFKFTLLSAHLYFSLLANFVSSLCEPRAAALGASRHDCYDCHETLKTCSFFKLVC